MDPPPWDYESFIDRIGEWAADRSDVRAVVLFGSRAREDRPADEWSDLDVVLVTTAPARYREGTEWLADLGDPWLTCLDEAPIEGFSTRHVLFDRGLEVDFVPVDQDRVTPVADLPDEVLQVLAPGYRVLVDEDDLAAELATRLEGVSVEDLALHVPDEAAFVDTVHDAWYRALWVAKKLRRGELWAAKSRLDGDLKQECLLPMLTWHARVVHGRRSWHAGRFLEEWADERVVAHLGDTFAGYDERDCWRGLAATMELFRWIARETATAADYRYPETAVDRASALVKDLSPR